VSYRRTPDQAKRGQNSTAKEAAIFWRDKLKSSDQFMAIATL